MRFTKRGSVASVVFDWPEARHAITMVMYDQLAGEAFTDDFKAEVRAFLAKQQPKGTGR